MHIRITGEPVTERVIRKIILHRFLFYKDSHNNAIASMCVYTLLAHSGYWNLSQNL